MRLRHLPVAAEPDARPDRRSRRRRGGAAGLAPRGDGRARLGSARTLPHPRRTRRQPHRTAYGFARRPTHSPPCSNSIFLSPPEKRPVNPSPHPASRSHSRSTRLLRPTTALLSIPYGADLHQNLVHARTVPRCRVPGLPKCTDSRNRHLAPPRSHRPKDRFPEIALVGGSGAERRLLPQAPGQPPTARLL